MDTRRHPEMMKKMILVAAAKEQAES